MVIKLNLKVIVAVVTVILVISVALLFLNNKISASQVSVTSSKNYVCVPIIMYHEVKNTNTGKDAITPYEFESDLKYLKKNNFTTITMTDLINHVYEGTPLPENPIILTFDDGYLNNYVYVFPLLKKYNMKIVMSIIGKDTDNFTDVKNDDLDYSHVTWDQINEMINSNLVEIQNHTYDLHSINSSRYGCKKMPGESQAHYAGVLTTDLERLQNEIMFYTGHTPNTFTYPYGGVSSDSLPVLKSMGFKASLTCAYGVNIITSNPETLFGLRRICRSHGVTIQEAVTEGMKTLKYRKID